MAITLVGSSTGQVLAGTGTQDVNLPGSLQEGDYVLISLASDSNLVTSTDGVVGQGYTNLHKPSSAAPGRQLTRKFMGSTPDSVVTVTRHGTRRIAVAIQVWRGVDQTTSEDVALPTIVTGSSTTPAPPAITTVTDGCQIIVGFMLDDDDDSTVTSPSGYTNQVLENTGQASTTIGATTAMASLSQANFGTETPGTWTGVSSDAWAAFTVALRPAAPAVNVDSWVSDPPQVPPPKRITIRAGQHDWSPTPELFTGSGTAFGVSYNMVLPGTVFQYTAHVEPLEVAPPPEDVTVDKWFPSVPMAPVRQRITAGLYTVDVGIGWIVDLGWLPQYADFARAAQSPVRTGGAVEGDVPRTTQIDWTPVYPDRAHAAQQRHPTEVVSSTEPLPDPEVITADKWLGVWASLTRTAQPRTPSEALHYTGEPIAPVIDIFPDAWHGQWAPLRTRLRGATALDTAGPVEPIPYDGTGGLSLGSSFVQVLPPVVIQYPAHVAPLEPPTPPEEVTLDKWFQQPVDIRVLPTMQSWMGDVFHGLEPLPDAPPTVTVDMWFTQDPQAPRRPRSVAHTGGTSYVGEPIVEVPPPDYFAPHYPDWVWPPKQIYRADWVLYPLPYPQPAQAIQKTIFGHVYTQILPPLSYQYQARVEPLEVPPPPGLDKWHPHFPEFVVRQLRPTQPDAYNGPLEPIPVEPTSVDKWLSVYPDLARGPAPRPHGLTAQRLDIPDASPVSVDAWFMQLSEPVHQPRHITYVMTFTTVEFVSTPPPPVPLFSWYIPWVAPVHARRTPAGQDRAVWMVPIALGSPVEAPNSCDWLPGVGTTGAWTETAPATGGWTTGTGLSRTWTKEQPKECP